MKFRTYVEATSFIKAFQIVKEGGKREMLGVKLDSTPAWEGASPILHALDGAEIDAVYLSYLIPTDEQKQAALPAKLAGVKLERITGRLVDVRKVKDGTVQVLFTNGLRDAEGEPAYRGPNVDKGILCALSIGEGLGESVDEIIARVPQEMIDRLREGKDKQRAAKGLPAKTRPEQIRVKVGEGEEVTVTITVSRGATVVDVPGVEDDKPASVGRVKLK